MNLLQQRGWVQQQPTERQYIRLSLWLEVYYGESWIIEETVDIGPRQTLISVFHRTSPCIFWGLGLSSRSTTTTTTSTPPRPPTWGLWHLAVRHTTLASRQTKLSFNDLIECLSVFLLIAPA